MKLSELTQNDDVQFEEKPMRLSDLKHNDDVQFEDEPTKMESLKRGAIQGATFGWADEIAGGVNAGIHLGSKILPYESPYESKEEAYKDGRDIERTKDSKAKKTNPGSYMGGNFVGGALIPGAVGFKGATVLGAMGRGAIAGSATGAIAGVGESEKNDAAGLAKDAAVGGAVGGVLGGVAGGLANVGGRALSQKGRQSLRDEAAAFSRGAEKSTEKGIIESIPVAGPITMKTYHGAKETVTGAKARSDFSSMITEQKAKLAEKIAKADGVDISEVRNSLDNMADDEFVLRSLMDDGPNEVKAWVAKTASTSTPGQIGSDDYQKILEMGPDTRNAARAFAGSKKEIAKELTPMVNDANQKIKAASNQRVNDLTEVARGKMKVASKENAPKTLELLADIQTTFRDIMDTNLIPKRVKNTVVNAQEILTEGKGLSNWELVPGELTNIPAPEQFKRLQKFRETLDLEIDWEAIKSKRRPMNEGEKVLASLRDKADELLKTIPEKTQADYVYQLGAKIRDNLFKKTEFKGGVDEYKINRLFNNSDEALRFRRDLDELKIWANDDQYAPEARKVAEDLVEKFETLYTLNDKAKMIVNFKYKQGPSSPAIERLGSTLNKNTLVQDAVKAPGGFVNSADEFVKNYAKDLAGKSYKEMTEIEKSALIRVWGRIKSESNNGNNPTPDAIKNWYSSFLDKK